MKEPGYIPVYAITLVTKISVSVIQNFQMKMILSHYFHAAIWGSYDVSYSCVR